MSSMSISRSTINRNAFPCSIIGVFASPSKLLPPRIVPAKTKESAAPFWLCALPREEKTPLHNQLEFFAGVVPSKFDLRSWFSAGALPRGITNTLTIRLRGAGRRCWGATKRAPLYAFLLLPSFLSPGGSGKVATKPIPQQHPEPEPMGSPYCSRP